LIGSGQKSMLFSSAESAPKNSGKHELSSFWYSSVTGRTILSHDSGLPLVVGGNSSDMILHYKPNLLPRQYLGACSVFYGNCAFCILVRG
jgi:hypothetical protein